MTQRGCLQNFMELYTFFNSALSTQLSCDMDFNGFTSQSHSSVTLLPTAQGTPKPTTNYLGFCHLIKTKPCKTKLYHIFPVENIFGYQVPF